MDTESCSTPIRAASPGAVAGCWAPFNSCALTQSGFAIRNWCTIAWGVHENRWSSSRPSIWTGLPRCAEAVRAIGPRSASAFASNTTAATNNTTTRVPRTMPTHFNTVPAVALACGVTINRKRVRFELVQTFGLQLYRCSRFRTSFSRDNINGTAAVAEYGNGEDAATEEVFACSY